MTQATGRIFGIKPFGGAGVPIPHSLVAPLAASVAPFRNWLLGFDSSGNLVAHAAGVTGLAGAGFSDRDEASSGTAGEASEQVRQQVASGFPNSTATLDAMLQSDAGSECYAADNQTIGKLSNQGGSNRSMLGLFLQIDPDNGTPIVYFGPIGWTLARAAHLANHANGGTFKKAIDAGANTDLAEDILDRPPLHGTVVKVGLSVSGTTLAASGNTDFKTLILQKRDGAGGAPVTVATANTKTTAFTQWTEVAFTLSVVAGALDILETDILTISETHGGAGAIIPAGNLRVQLKVG